MKRLFFVTLSVMASFIFSMDTSLDGGKRLMTRRPSNPLERVRGASFGTKDFIQAKEQAAKNYETQGTRSFDRRNFAVEENITLKTLQRGDSFERK